MEIMFKKWKCDLHFEGYKTGNTALRLTDVSGGETIAVCTINLPDLQEDEIAIKDYSENLTMYQTLLDYKIITTAHRFTESGYIKNIPVCRLNWEGGGYD